MTRDGLKQGQIAKGIGYSDGTMSFLMKMNYPFAGKRAMMYSMMGEYMLQQDRNLVRCANKSCLIGFLTVIAA